MLRTLIAVLATCATAFAQNPQLYSIVNGADGSAAIGAGGLAKIQGGDLARATCGSTTAVTTLCNVQVLASGTPLNLVTVNASEVGFVAPNAAGTYSISVSNLQSGQSSNALAITVQTSALAFFNDHGVIQGKRQNGSALGFSNPTPGGETLSLYATGGGLTGQRPALNIDGIALPDSAITFAGLDSQYGGVWRYDVAVPTLTTGAHALWACVENRCVRGDILASQTGSYFVGNIANISGVPKTYSFALLHDASFGVSPLTNVVNTSANGNFLVDAQGWTTALLYVGGFTEYPAMQTITPNKPVFQSMIDWTEDPTAKFRLLPGATWDKTLTGPISPGTGDPLNSFFSQDVYPGLKTQLVPALNTFVATYSTAIFNNVALKNGLSPAPNTISQWNTMYPGPIKIYLNPSQASSAILKIMRGALRSWDYNGKQRFIEVSYDPTIDLNDTGVTVEYISSGYDAAGALRRSGGSYYGHMTIDPATNSVTTIAHELGHILGLPHSPDPHSIMYSSPAYAQLHANEVPSRFDLAWADVLQSLPSPTSLQPQIDANPCMFVAQFDTTMMQCSGPLGPPF